MTTAPLQTEFEFTLPQGFVDDEGTLHRDGRMRLASAADEIEPIRDPRVQSNSAYFQIVLLARVVTELGTLESVNTRVIEELFIADLAHLQRLYDRINGQGSNSVETTCPECGEEFDVSVDTGAVMLNSRTGIDGTDAPTAGAIQETTGGEGGSGNVGPE